MNKQTIVNNIVSNVKPRFQNAISSGKGEVVLEAYEELLSDFGELGIIAYDYKDVLAIIRDARSKMEELLRYAFEHRHIK